MSTPAERGSERSPHQGGSLVCKPLIDAATKDLFRKNAFRITGLPVDATTREVARHADKLKMLVELGQDAQPNPAFPIYPPPTLDDIREAIQRLKDPEERLIDEFFWFWPEEYGKSQSEAEIQALAKGDVQAASEIWSAKEDHPSKGVVAKHNLALVVHIAALDWENYSVTHEVEAEQRRKIEDFWKRAFSRWEKLATDDQFWETVAARIRQLNEPNLPTGFARRMRATLPEALAKINAELAVAFAESGKIELARLHIQFMRETNQGLDNVEKTAELVLTPAIIRFKDQIKQAEGRAKDTPKDGASAAKELLQHAQRAASIFDLFFGKDSDLRNDLLDEAVAVCNRLQVAYHNAIHDDDTCLDILNSVLPLATSIELRQQIEKNISTLMGFTLEREKHDLHLDIRSDHIEMDCDEVRYNSVSLPIRNITGVRLGVFTQYTNGIKTSVSYLIGVCSDSHGSIQIECKRLFGSEDKAKADFNAILNSLFYHVVPDLCTRIAKQIAAGHECPVGDARLTAQGIRATVGILLWKEEVLIPWSEVRFGISNGQLSLTSTTNRKFSKSYSLREVWNAVIFEQIANLLMTLR